MLQYILTHFSYQEIFLEVNEHNLAAQQLYFKTKFSNYTDNPSILWWWKRVFNAIS
ncbi:hypothetical protein [Spiroplasma endosymbiont of Polydrusus formosus]|uniref:hypothetical protein n=1 Tax=Spiroplasma endosymbiont of Polydrusus formosus TaxID=3139326 RepID=UPI0035B55F1B